MVLFLQYHIFFANFVRFLFFLADLNSRGIILKIAHKIKQNLKGVKVEK